MRHSNEAQNAHFCLPVGSACLGRKKCIIRHTTAATSEKRTAARKCCSPAGCTAGGTTAASVFIDLRDTRGLVQVVFNPKTAPEAHAVAEQVRSEYVLRVRGTVSPRPAGTENAGLPSGEVEVVAERGADPEHGEDAARST